MWRISCTECGAGYRVKSDVDPGRAVAALCTGCGRRFVTRVTLDDAALGDALGALRPRFSSTAPSATSL